MLSRSVSECLLEMERFGDENYLIDGVTTGPILNPRGLCSACPSRGHCSGVCQCPSFGRKLGTTNGSQTQMDAKIEQCPLGRSGTYINPDIDFEDFIGLDEEGGEIDKQLGPIRRAAIVAKFRSISDDSGNESSKSSSSRETIGM